MNKENVIKVLLKRIYIICMYSALFIIFLSIYVYPQPFKITSARYNIQKVNVGCSIVFSPDNSLFLASYVEDTHKRDIYVLRLTKELDTVWTKKINCDYLTADPTILHIPSNRLLVLGNYGCNGLFVMMDENGKTLWQKEITYKKRCVSILNGLVLKNKNLVLVGATYGFVGNRKAYVTLTDSMGVLIWEKEFDLGKISNATTITLNSSDKNSIIVGCNNSINSYLLCIELNNGILRWRKKISDNWTLNSISALQDDNYLLAGYTDWTEWPDKGSRDEGIIIKVNSKGEILWTKRNDFDNWNSFCSIKKVNENKYIIGGYKWIDMGIYNFTLTTFYDSSDSIDSFTYSDSLFSIANDICIAGDNEYFMTGSTFRYPTDEERSDLYVVRFKLLSDH